MSDGNIFAAKLNVDEVQVSQLVEMGFPRNACIKAVYHTKNAGVEQAMNWVMEHMDDLGAICAGHACLPSLDTVVLLIMQCFCYVEIGHCISDKHLLASYLNFTRAL
jgi:hypothetical protein